MKKNLRNTCAKTLAVVLALGMVASVSPASADAAAKKPTVTKKVSVNVGKTKTVKVTSKKKVKKTTWSLTKAGKKVVSLSKKKAKSVTVKGKKAGKATLTAKIKVGKKTYKKTCKITVTKAAVVTTKPTAQATTNTNGGGTSSATPSATPTATPSATPSATPTVPPVTANPPVQPEKPATDPAVLPELNLREEAATAWSKEGSYGTAIFNTDDTVSYSSQPWAIDTATGAVKEGSCYNNGIAWFIDANTQGQVDLSEYGTVEITVKTDAEVKLMTWAGTADATSFWDKNDVWGGTSDVRENEDGSKTLVYSLATAFGNAAKVKKAVAIGLTLKSDKDGDDAAFAAREATIYSIRFVEGSAVEPIPDTSDVDTPDVDTSDVAAPIKELKESGYTSLTDLGVTLDTTKTYESVTFKIKAFNAAGDVITPEDENYATYGSYPKLTLGTETSVTNENGAGYANGAGGNTSDYSATWGMYFLNNIGKYGVEADSNGYIEVTISLFDVTNDRYLTPGTDYDGIGLQTSAADNSISGIAIYSVTFNEKAD